MQRLDPNYHIEPDTDIPAWNFNSNSSFVEKTGFEEYGTQRLRHRDQIVRCSGRQHYDFGDFAVVKTTPFAPNAFLHFFKAGQSIHAVKAVSPHVPNGRYGKPCQLYEPGIGLFWDLSHSDLLAENHHGD